MDMYVVLWTIGVIWFIGFVVLVIYAVLCKTSR